MSNLTGSQVSVTVSYADFSGTVLETKSYSVPRMASYRSATLSGHSWISTQTSQKEGYLILDPTTEGAITAYATPIDNSTQDFWSFKEPGGKAHI